jgi:hypothetical protein
LGYYRSAQKYTGEKLIFMMVQSKVYKGIEFVQLSELPQEQREMLSNTLNRSLVIKILVSGKILNDCIQFRDYITWYEGIYKVQHPTDRMDPSKQGINTSVKKLVIKDN